MYSARIVTRQRRLIIPPTLLCIDQKLQEFHSPRTYAMIYPAAVRQYVANAFSCVSPLFVSPSGGGGGATSSKRRNESTPQPPKSAKTPRRSQTKARNSEATRSSPRIHNKNSFATNQRQRLGDGKNLNSSMPPIQEIAVNGEFEDDASKMSMDLLELSQTTVQGTQLAPRLPTNTNTFFQKDDYSDDEEGDNGSGASHPSFQGSAHHSTPAKSQSSDSSPSVGNNSFENPYSDLFTESAASKPFDERLKHFMRGKDHRQKS